VVVAVAAAVGILFEDFLLDQAGAAQNRHVHLLHIMAGTAAQAAWRLAGILVN
jgi:hypothetical protein